MQTNQASDHQWACGQIEKYRDLYPRYSKYAQTLQQVLEKASLQFAPLAIVQTRPKSITSFAEKTLRKKKKYRDPLRRMTDLCGGRVITQTQAEVRAVCEFLEKHFDIDRDNSVDVGQRLKPTEFGYRSIHYIVQFQRGVFPTKVIPIEIPDELYPDEASPMKAEIQVRTVLEHAWAGFTHDRVYKGAFTIPDKWQRELAVLAGMLEEVDQSFSRIQTGLRTYAAGYGAYLSAEQLREEIDLLETVLSCDPQNVELAHRLGKLAMTLGDWQRAVDLFSKFVDTGYQPILRDLGVVLCKLHANDPTGAPYRQGQKYLEAAGAPPYQDADALASLAGTWKNLDEAKTRTLYRRAYEVDPSDPYAASNYLVYEIIHQRDLAPASLMAPALTAAIQRCRDQAEVGMNLPWAFYNLGMFYLLLGQPYDSLTAYAKAIQLSTDDWMVETSQRLIERLIVVRDSLEGYEWVRKLLLVGRAVYFSNEVTLKQIRGLASTQAEPITGPVVIVAGGTDASIEAQLPSYRRLMIEAFRDFRGTILAGGTKSGVSGLVGEIQADYPGFVRTIGYVPKSIPAGVQIDRRYSQIRRTEGNDFSALEPLQGWIDLIAAGIPPSQVKLLGINGGTISAVEYRMPLALGASVAVLEGSGREAAKMLPDKYWGKSNTLLRLPADPMAARAFIGSGSPKLEAPIREAIAQAIHAAYREEQIRNKPNLDPALAEWDGLLGNLKESNRMQADHILEKILQIGCTLHKTKGNKISRFTFTDIEVEILAEMEHGRWVVERLQDGWKWASERDDIKKTSPYLVPWSDLPAEVKEWDRDTTRKIPQFLATAGMEIRREKGE